MKFKQKVGDVNFYSLKLSWNLRHSKVFDLILSKNLTVLAGFESCLYLELIKF